MAQEQSKNFYLGSTGIQSAQLKITYINQSITVQTVNPSLLQTQKLINTASLSLGVYVISLYVDHQFTDSKQLVIQ